MKGTNQRLAIILAVCAFLFNGIEYSPGFMSPDTLDQYRQAIGDYYVDWHPAVMAYFWHILNYIYKGPQIMLAFQLSLLWSAYYMLATTYNSKRWAVSMFVVFFLAPFIQNIAGFIVKDAQMGLCWLFATTVWVKYYVNNKRIPVLLQVLSLAALFYGSWVRFNSLSALLPMCFIWVSVTFRNKKLWSQLALACMLFCSVIITQKAFLKLVVKPSKGYPQDVLYMHDLTAVFVKTGENVFPAIMYNNPQFDTAYIRLKFHPAIYDQVLWNDDNKQLVVFSDSIDAALHDAWTHMIKTNTTLYLQNRWETFKYFLKIGPIHTKAMYMFPWIHPNEFGYIVKEERLPYKMFHEYMYFQFEAFYWDAWFWVALNLALFLLIPLTKDKMCRRLVAMISLSGLLYVLPQYILITTDRDFRYIYWTCIACMLAIVFFVLDKVMFKKPSSIAAQ